MKGIVFKQSYKPMNKSSTAILNRKHLVYIATRKGAIHNYGCGFGLFGNIANMKEAGVIDDFEHAKKVITAVSHRRTIYRAIVSIDDQTAKDKGLYNRAEWEKLCYEHIKSIAKEMDISPRSMCWTASYHHAKGHPHVHIMYWDNSSKVREEHVNTAKFEIMTEHVKAAFNKGIYKEEIHVRQQELSTEEKLIREEVRAMFRESNVADVLNLENVSTVKLNEVGKHLYGLTLDVPKYGRLAYAYLPKGYKVKVDACVDSILAITDFNKQMQKLVRLTDEISEYYGNGAEKIEHNHKMLSAEIHTQLGNEIMRFVRAYQKELLEHLPEAREAKLDVICKAFERLLRSDDDYHGQLAYLIDAMPKERTARYVLMQDPKWCAAFRVLFGSVCRDMRITTLTKAAIEASTVGLSDETAGIAEKAAFNEIKSMLSKQLWSMLYNEKNYMEQEQNDLALTTLIDLFRFFSQGTHQKQNRLNYERHRGWGEKSKTAKQERIKQQQQDSGWSIER